MEILVRRYRQMPQGVKASFWTIISSILLKGIGFITLPIFTRLLSTTEYGVLAIYSSWVSLLSILLTLTVWGGVFNVGMVKYPDRAHFISAIQGLSVTSVILSGIAALLFLGPLSQLLGMNEFLVLCMFAEILATIPFNIWLGEQTFDFLYKKKVIITIVMSIVNPLLGYWAVVSFSCHVEARVLSGLLPQVLVGIFFFWRQQRRGKAFFDSKLWRYVLGFNAVLILHYLSMQVLNQSDRIMINALVGSSKAGIYSVAYNFAMLLNLVANGLDSSLTGYVYRCLKSDSIDKLARVNSMAAMFVGACALFIICLVPDVFRFMLPPAYHEALQILPIVTLAAYFMFLYPMFGAVEFYYEVNHYVTIASCVGAGLNVALNALCIPVFGYVAAAYTTLICYICFAVSHYYFMERVLRQKGNGRKVFAGDSIVRISVALTIMCFSVSVLYEMDLYRWLFIVAILVVMVMKRQDIRDSLKIIRKKES